MDEPTEIFRSEGGGLFDGESADASGRLESGEEAEGAAVVGFAIDFEIGMPGGGAPWIGMGLDFAVGVLDRLSSVGLAGRLVEGVAGVMTGGDAGPLSGGEPGLPTGGVCCFVTCAGDTGGDAAILVRGSAVGERSGSLSECADFDAVGGENEIFCCPSLSDSSAFTISGSTFASSGMNHRDSRRPWQSHETASLVSPAFGEGRES